MAKQTMSAEHNDALLAAGVAPDHIRKLQALPFSIPWAGLIALVQKYGPSLARDLIALFLNIQPEPAAAPTDEENPPKPPTPGQEPAFKSKEKK